MHILVHDFAGHAFQVQLSRELASRGHTVHHVYPLGLAGPKGRLDRSPQDPDRFQIRPVSLSQRFSKYSPIKRFLAQREYARDLKALIDAERPDVVLSGNTPIDIQAELLWHSRLRGIAFVHWVQDVYSRAIEFFFRRKLGSLARLVSAPFTWLDKVIARKSNRVIVISPAFADICFSWGVETNRLTVLENWAPLDEVRYLPRDNDWSDAHGLKGKTVFLYSGTMGLKHRPELLYGLAECLDETCTVVVVTEGIGRDYLEHLPRRNNLLLLDFQPYANLSQVLASADVLVATLESEAGQFAVPSKILSYLCAGRPILLSAPEDNLAAIAVKRSGSGCIAPPDSQPAWVDAAKLLASDASLRSRLGAKARTYAEKSFDIGSIASQFEQVLSGAVRPASEKISSFEEGRATTIQGTLPPLNS